MRLKLQIVLKLIYLNHLSQATVVAVSAVFKGYQFFTSPLRSQRLSIKSSICSMYIVHVETLRQCIKNAKTLEYVQVPAIRT